jgi:hypothetical protein
VICWVELVKSAALTTVQAAYEPAALPTFTPSSEAPSSWKGDLLAVGIFEESLAVEGESVSMADAALTAVDASLSGILAEMLTAGDFKAKKVRRRGPTLLFCWVCFVDVAPNNSSVCGPAADHCFLGFSYDVLQTAREASWKRMPVAVCSSRLQGQVPRSGRGRVQYYSSPESCCVYCQGVNAN